MKHKTLKTCSLLVIITVIFYIHHENKKIDILKQNIEDVTKNNLRLSKRITNLKTQLIHKEQFINQPSNSTPKAQEAFPQITRQTITRQLLKMTFERAKKATEEGHYSEALTKYLWCYDATGVADRHLFLRVTYGSQLLERILDLEVHVPHAAEELKVRRDSAEQSLTSGSIEASAVGTYTAINKALGESYRSIVFFDNTQLDKSVKSNLRTYLRDEFIQAQRYEEASRTGILGYGTMILNQAANYTPSNEVSDQRTEELRAQKIADAIPYAAKDIEALVGVGEIEDGIAYANQVLQLNNSPETLRLLKSHLIRAGKPEVFDALIQEPQN